MKEKITRFKNTYCSLICLLFIVLSTFFAIIMGLIYLDKKYPEKFWNDGYCQCGGEFEYVQWHPDSYGEIKYYYECNKCHNIKGFYIRK